MTRDTDLFVVGGGPAGLAAALSARKHGFSVAVADRGRPPIDKACGEGLMPDGVAALRQLGVDIGAGHGAPFRGIRFLDGGLEAEAPFPNGACGVGIRRTKLHELIVRRAEEAGVALHWQAQVEARDPGSVRVDRQLLRYRWLIGADGFHSRIRHFAGIAPVWSTAQRIGIRQHFRGEPWTDFVEVYWNRHAQANVTPVGPDEICIALIGTKKEVRAADIPALFPKLAARLLHTEPLGSPRGALTMSSRFSSVTSGNIALIGDASGTVDAVTGEGMHIAFRQASALTGAIAAGDLRLYSRAHRQIERMPQFMARLLLLLDENDIFRRLAFHALANCPGIFRALLAFHLGALPASRLPSGSLDLLSRLLPTPQITKRGPLR